MLREKSYANSAEGKLEAAMASLGLGGIGKHRDGDLVWSRLGARVGFALGRMDLWRCTFVSFQCIPFQRCRLFNDLDP
jgi:hypothetical protein